MNLSKSIKALFGLRTASAVMAMLCGLAGAAFAIMIATMLASGVYGQLTGANLDWRRSTPDMSLAVTHKQKRAACSPTANGGMKCAPLTTRPKLADAAPPIAGLTVAMVPGAALAYGLFQAALCFVGLASGKYLHRSTVLQLTRFAVAGLIFLFANPIAGALGRAAAYLTYHAIQLASGERGYAWFSNFNNSYKGVDDILTPIYAITLTIIALIMVRASRIAEDHAQIV